MRWGHLGLWVFLWTAATTGLGCGDEHGSQTRLRILVTNDDGYAAEGIDALVAALAGDPRNDVTVSAPSSNRSGSGDDTGPSPRCGDLSAVAATTRSGYPAVSVNGCPADSVNHALAFLYPADQLPQVVISGINEGQNITLPVATRLSGTVGAALTAARRGIPSLAASQGVPQTGETYDYATGVVAVLDWIEERRAVLLDGIFGATVTNLNIPSCLTGTQPRGILVDIPLATAPSNAALAPQDCSSTITDPRDDAEAFVNGYITFSHVPISR